MIQVLDNLDPKFELINTQIFETSLEKYGGPVWITTSKSANPSISELVGLKNDFEYSQKLLSPHVLKGLEFVKSGGKAFVVKEYMTGQPLHIYIDNNQICLKEALEITSAVAKALNEIHENGVVIKDLCPHHILLKKNPLTVKINSFGHASDIGKEKDSVDLLGDWNESMAYLSPEQTGRIGRSTDYRSDYYALGAILYKLLTGQDAFPFKTLVEVIHAHIAKSVVAPDELNPTIPKPLSELVLKLMSKNAEERYQSGVGLIHDLNYIQEHLDDKQILQSFELGTAESSRVFNLSEKLYGREYEMEVLRKAFYRISGGPIEILYVYGYSGVGKTRLINELHQKISGEKGFFTSGKFDQYHKETPYFAFIQAFENLLHQLLSEDKERVYEWRVTLNERLGDRGQVLMNLVPGLELLLGPQEPVYDLGFRENQQRFIKTVIDFFSVLDISSRPLVMFIDDLQWADVTSIDLLTALAGSDLRNILIICSFRNNEVDENHPLSLQMKWLQKDFSERVEELKLTELTDENVNELISDSLNSTADKTIDLTKLITQKTKGNPFFVRQFVLSLVEADHIKYDTLQHVWNWNLQAIQSLDVTENVVDLLVRKIKELDFKAQHLISLASCIGNSWDDITLGIIAQISDKDMARSISKIIKHGFVSPISPWNEHYIEMIQLIKEPEHHSHWFRFQHDKIQQAANHLIDEEDKQDTHHQIGHLLLDGLTERQVDDSIFDILDHLNYAISLATSDEARRELAELNLRGSIKAKNTNAIETAIQYLEITMSLLNEDRGDLYMNALIIRSECEYLLGNFAQSEALFDTAFSDAKSALEKADVLSRKMIVYENTQRHPEALSVAREALMLLGTDFPADDDPEIVGKEFGYVQEKLKEFDIDSLLNHQELTDPRILLTMKILMNLWGPLYLMARQNQLAFMVLRLVRLSMTHGNSTESAVAYAFYGYVISAQMQAYEQGYEFGQLGLRLNEKLKDKTMRSRILVIAEGCVSHWKIPYSEVLPKVRQAHQLGIETNDLVYSGYATTFMSRCLVFGDQNLKDSYEVLNNTIKFASRIKHDLAYHVNLAWQRWIVQMTGIEPVEKTFGALLEEERHLEILIEYKESGSLPVLLTIYNIAQSIRCYHMEDYSRGFQYAQDTLEILPSIMGLMEWGEHPIFQLLNLLGMAKSKPGLLEDHQELYDSTIQIIQKRAESCPHNFEPKYLLILAEYQQIKSNNQEKLDLFENALSSAKAYGQMDVQGIVHKLLAQLAYTRQDFESGIEHTVKAIQAYREWGADSVAQKILGYYDRLAEFWRENMYKHPDSNLYTKDSIDMQSVVSAAATLSSEVRLEDLLDKLLQILIKNAGAQNAYLFLLKDFEPKLEAYSKMADDFESKFPGTSLDSVQDVAASLVRRAFNIGETILIADGTTDPLLARERLVNDIHAKSVLCLPIKTGNKIGVVLYLDNELSTHAFTSDRVELLQMLSGQIAISIDNALLYENLERKVHERTATIEDQNIALEEEKQKVDKLLLNILPSDVAASLKSEGSYVPRHYDNVSILFTDFVSFTNFVRMISPQELVDMIDHCYKGFDAICEKHGLEKIKTIGDSYMCVGGLPGTAKNHGRQVCLAGLEMLEFTNSYNQIRQQNKQLYCDIRVGIHSGPIVAGVVGDRKFSFDIWGDSVNTASRMQESSQPGKLNVSQSTYDLVQDYFEIDPRGLVEIKNGGQIHMYFVNQRKPDKPKSRLIN